jgi:tetratricopeptide (TPR) repeat protein
MTELLAGQFHESRRQYEALARAAAMRTKVQRFVMSLLGLSSALLRLGALDEAMVRLEQAREALEPGGSPALKLRCVGQMAGVHARRGEIDQAVACARVVTTAPSEGPMLLGLGATYGHAAEAYLASLARAPESGPAEIAEARAALRRITRRLRGTSLFVPIAGPIFLRIQGRVYRAEGALEKAKRSWDQGLAAAVKLDLPYDQALARLDLARAEPPGSGVRERHLDVAEALCAEMGCRSELAEIEALRV